ncbi:hypothetical protein EJB05_24610, partial [Eragrostis curvula]
MATRTDVRALQTRVNGVRSSSDQVSAGTKLAVISGWMIIRTAYRALFKLCFCGVVYYIFARPVVKEIEDLRKAASEEMPQIREECRVIRGLLEERRDSEKALMEAKTKTSDGQIS